VQIFKNLVTDVDTDDGPNNDTLPNDFQASFTIATGTPVETAAVHLTMGNPTSAIDSFATPNNFLMAKPDFAMSYNRDKGTANWVSWHLSSDWFTSGNRTDTFRPDPALPPTWYRVLQTDYSGSGYDRGHMCPSADRSITIPINQATFLMSNMVPQTPENNQGPWEDFEGYLRTLAACPGPCNELYIVSGPTGSIGTIANGHVTVPSSTWKVVLVLSKLDGNDVQRVNAATRTIAINIPNIGGIRETAWGDYLTTVSSVEQLTGYNFFSNVPQIVQNSIEAGSNGTNPPGVANESASTDEDQPVNVTLNAVSPDPAATYSYTISTSPAHGTLSASGATYTYTPAPNYNGTDSFTFRVNDGHATSNTATVSLTIRPVNDAPVLTAVPSSLTVDELTAASFTANANDVDGDSVTFSLVGAPAGATIASNGAFSWTPSEAQGPASYTFTVHASDGTASADAPVTIVVNEVNNVPVLASISAQTVILGNTLTFGASATDSDVPAQTIVYGLSSAPAGASIDTATGAFTWTPSGAQAGLTFNFTVTATDGVATTSTPVTATVVDDAAPVISPLTLSITQLWPANHKMVAVTVTYSATDAGDTAPSCTLKVSSNEPIDGLGDGDTAPDWSIVDAHHLQLRAERAGNGTGRVYTIGADCTDRFGNLSHSATVTVSVPLNSK
jgi:endonuclease G